MVIHANIPHLHTVIGILERLGDRPMLRCALRSYLAACCLCRLPFPFLCPGVRRFIADEHRHFGEAGMCLSLIEGNVTAHRLATFFG